MIVRMPRHDRLNTAPDEAAEMPNGMLDSPFGACSPEHAFGPGAAPPWSSCPGRPRFLPPDLILEPISRKPTVLPETTVRTVQSLQAGAARVTGPLTPEPFGPAARTFFPRVSIVVITRDNLVFSKLCLESVLANTDYPC